MKTIDTSIYTFEELIRRNCLYVDKTAFVWKLVNGCQLYFLSRPRRFGKSLLLSTFEAFFKGKKELFKGLAIEQLAPEKWDAYPVIKLDMAQASAPTACEMGEKLLKMLCGIAHDYQVKIRESCAAGALSSLVSALVRKTKKQVVILIDNYGDPLSDNIGRDFAPGILYELLNFYQIVKSENEHERFVFITGETEFEHATIASGINNLTDITRLSDYATLLGYTQKELEENFADYIDATAAKLATPRSTRRSTKSITPKNTKTFPNITKSSRLSSTRPHGVSPGGKRQKKMQAGKLI